MLIESEAACNAMHIEPDARSLMKKRLTPDGLNVYLCTLFSLEDILFEVIGLLWITVYDDIEGMDSTIPMTVMNDHWDGWLEAILKATGLIQKTDKESNGKRNLYTEFRRNEGK